MDGHRTPQLATLASDTAVVTHDHLAYKRSHLWATMVVGSRSYNRSSLQLAAPTKGLATGGMSDTIAGTDGTTIERHRQPRSHHQELDLGSGDTTTRERRYYHRQSRSHHQESHKITF
ncbi:hypothetical protein BHM03_00028844 [Ensete ventricosum]|nr:hypothetical protein BHM03_00028844 [Ensete ventricosum]